MAKIKGIGLATPSVATRDYDAESDMHTLRRAQEIMMDKPRHRAATGMAKTHMKLMAKVAGKMK